MVDLMGGAALEKVYDSLRSGVNVPHGPRAEARSLVCAKGRSRVSLVNLSDDAEKQLTPLFVPVCLLVSHFFAIGTADRQGLMERIPQTGNSREKA